MVLRAEFEKMVGRESPWWVLPHLHHLMLTFVVQKMTPILENTWSLLLLDLAS